MVGIASLAKLYKKKRHLCLTAKTSINLAESVSLLNKNMKLSQNVDIEKDISGKCSVIMYAFYKKIIFAFVDIY